MSKKSPAIKFKRLPDETIGVLEQFPKQLPKTLDQVVKRQILLAAACVALHKSIDSLADALVSLEERLR